MNNNLVSKFCETMQLQLYISTLSTVQYKNLSVKHKCNLTTVLQSDCKQWYQMSGLMPKVLIIAY